MANSKHQNPFSAFTFFFFLILVTNAKSDSLSFNFPSFETIALNILTDGDAKTTGGVLQLTNKDQSGFPTQHSVGLAIYFGAVHIADKATGKLANFTTDFSFVVNPKGTEPHGDDFTFFLASLDFDFPDNSTSSFLSLFNYKIAFNILVNSVVDVEFDSFANEWDIDFLVSDSLHIGIDINSVKSLVTVPWPSESQPQGAIAKARVAYESSTTQLSVSVVYPSSHVALNTTVLSYPIDLRAILSEFVLIGFSGFSDWQLVTAKAMATSDG